jgi:DNA repair exonuclease SbcCD ATPase subunit
MAALGSEHVSLKSDTDEGHVELEIGDSTYIRTLSRTDDAAGPTSVNTGGEPYVKDAELADLFAFLLETNEARQAVAQGDDLRELIMRPIDTDTLQAEIDQLESEKRDLDAEIEQLDQLEDRLPDLEEERTDLDEQIEEQREQLEATEADLEDADRDVEETREEKEALDAKLDDLSSARSAVEDARLDIQSERKSLEALRDEKEDLDADLDDHPGDGEGEIASPAAETDDIESEPEDRRDRIQELETMINELQTIIGFNEDMVEGESASTAVLTALCSASGEAGVDEDGDRASALTDQLVADSDTICWTCGSEVEQNRIEATLEHRETQVREGRRKVTKSVFDLHVIRSTENGTTYEDAIDHLSESERGVTGLVFALAGYLAHDLHESMPFMLLDSLETIDLERIAAFVDYFSDYVTHIVVTLLPEDAGALSEKHERITEI